MQNDPAPHKIKESEGPEIASSNEDLTTVFPSAKKAASELQTNWLAKKVKIKQSSLPILLSSMLLAIGLILATVYNEDIYLWNQVKSAESKCRSAGHLLTGDSQYIIFMHAASATHTQTHRNVYRKLLQMALTAARKEWGKYSMMRGDVLSELCVHYGTLGEWQKAEFYGSELIRNQLGLRGRRDSMLADGYSLLAWIANETGDYPKAKKLSSLARIINQKCCDPESQKMKQFRAFEKQLFVHQSSPFVYAGGGLTARHQEPEQDIGAGPAGLSVVSLAAAAFGAEKYKDFTKAEREYKRALERAAVTGPAVQCTATILNDYSCMLRSCGRNDEALKIEKQVDQIRSSYRPPDADFASIKENLH